jgi:uroporphyrinogen III methyltransferase/synthase
VIGALAYAGIPVTDRRHSASFAVVTGHKDPTRVSEDTRWADLGRAADTLVILMGMRNLEGLVEKIVAGGLSPETPAAVVMEGTLPGQRVVEAPLAFLPDRVREAGLRSPGVVVIGNVVRLREKIRWLEHRPLFGRRVLVTRTPEQAGPWMDALRAAGALPVSIPMIRVVSAEDMGPLDDALDRLRSYDALLITSSNAIRFLAERASERGVSLRDFAGAVVCVGPKSAETTLAQGLPVHTIPAERFDAEGMLEALDRHFPPEGRHFLLPRAEAARETLYDGLRASGARVDAVTAYRTVAPDTDADALRERLVAGRFDVLTFASPSAVRNFVSLLDDAARRAAADCLVAAIGPTTAEALRKEGLPADVVPERATAEGLVAALILACRDGGA